VLALTPSAGAQAAVSGPAKSPSLSAAVDSITGADDAGQVAAQSLCAAPKPGYAACAAQALVSKQNHELIHPRLARAHSVARTQVRATPSDSSPLALQADTEPAAAPLPQAGTPAFIQQAYDLTYLSETAGGSATVGIVDAYKDPTAASDLATFRSYYGLPACTTTNGCLTVDAQTNNTNSGWADEISLDLDAVSTICPNCHIVLVETPSSSLADLVAGIDYAHELGATYISNSWGEDQGQMSDSGFSFSGSTTFASAGDSGYTGSPQYPAALPDVTAVGGTTLTYAPQTARGYTESAWNGTGSGCDTTQSKPTWQTGDGTGCTGRSYDDVSADADPYTGLNVYSSQDGGWVTYGGTSLSSPMTAAYYALVGNLGATDAWPYLHASSLNDVTSGNNVDSSDYDPTCPSDPGVCQAGIGFDGPTGNGTISGDVVPGAPGVGSNGYSAGASGGSATVTVGVYPNSTDTQVYLEYGASDQYTAQTASEDIGSGAAAVQATFTLTGVTAGYHYRVVAANSYGTAYGYDVSLGTDTGWPSVTSSSVTPTTETTAQAAFTVNFNGSGSLYVEYGPTGAYGLTTASVPGSGTESGSVSLTGLAANTTYRWAIVITNGTDTFTTPDGTFTTPAQNPTGSGSSGADGAAAGSGAGAGAGAASGGSGSSGSGSRGSESSSGGTTSGGSASGGGATSRGLSVTSVTRSRGHYAVRVTCRATAGCVGYVTLVQRLSRNRTRSLGRVTVVLRPRASITLKFRSDARPPVATAVLARKG
jgi:hypothetical protein